MSRWRQGSVCLRRCANGVDETGGEPTGFAIFGYISGVDTSPSITDGAVDAQAGGNGTGQRRDRVPLIVDAVSMEEQQTGLPTVCGALLELVEEPE